MLINDIITDMIIRSAASGDMANIQRVCAEALDFEPDADELPSILQAAQQRFCLVAVADSEITGLCHGSLGRRRDDGRDGYVDLLAVAPHARLRGTGRQLLATAEDRLAALGATGIVLGGNPPVHLWPGVDARYTAMTCLAERAGYRRLAEAVDMAVDLDSAELDTGPDERRLTAAGVAVRQASHAESSAIVAWLRDGPWGRSTWPDEAAAALAHDPAGCHVASRDEPGQPGRAGAGDAAGYLGFACHGAVRHGWFGPMGTLDAARRSGIGSVLLKRCLADMRAAGLRTARIGWVGPVRFYAAAVGARVERVYWRYRKELRGCESTMI
jgi:mycothiol synthase